MKFLIKKSFYRIIVVITIVLISICFSYLGHSYKHIESLSFLFFILAISTIPAGIFSLIVTTDNEFQFITIDLSIYIKPKYKIFVSDLFYIQIKDKLFGSYRNFKVFNDVESAIEEFNKLNNELSNR